MLKRVIVYIISIAAISFSTDCSNQYDFSSNIKYNLILVMGQSNTHAGKGLDLSIDTTASNVFQLGRIGENDMKIIPAIEPIQHHTKSGDRIGFSLTVANLYSKYLEDSLARVLIIPCGYGGTGFYDKSWNQGDNLYEDAVRRVQFTWSKYPKSKLVMILWHQGEDDIHNKEYKDHLDKFILNIRDDLSANNVPFILGGMVPFWVNQDSSRINIQHIIADTKNRLPEVGYADPNLPFLIEKVDNIIDDIHFDATGQREIGVRYFNEYLRLL